MKSTRNRKSIACIAGQVAGLLPAAALVAPAVTAAPIQSPVVNLNIPITTAGLYINVVNGVSAALPGSALGWDLNLWGSSSFWIFSNELDAPSSGVMAFPGGSTTLVGNLSAGTFVDSSGTFLGSRPIATAGAGQFNLNALNYIGFRFLDETDSQYHYGWASIQLSGALNSAPRSIVELWYESVANTGIAVGDTGATGIPEPSSAALLALGAAGIAALRRRNRK